VVLVVDDNVAPVIGDDEGVADEERKRMANSEA
jgi:hypothetical protein